MIKLEFDAREFFDAMRGTPSAFVDGAITGMHNVLNDWQMQSRDVAPLDTGTLRRMIETKLDSQYGLNLTGRISANAYKGMYGAKRFNYAYYIHEVKGDSFKGRRPGTIGKFLDDPAKKSVERWQEQLEADIMRELERRGW